MNGRDLYDRCFCGRGHENGRGLCVLVLGGRGRVQQAMVLWAGLGEWAWPRVAGVWVGGACKWVWPCAAGICVVG